MAVQKPAKPAKMVFHFVKTSCRLVTMLPLILPILLIAFTEAKNETAVAKYHPKQNGAPVCQDTEFECYLFTSACKSVATKKLMHEACQYTCAICRNSKNELAFPKKYSAFFGSTQFKYYSNNYYSGYNGYCCGCYGGGFIGFAGYPQFGSFGIGGFGLLLEPIEGFLLGLGLSIGNGLANLGALLLGGGLNRYGYGFGNNYLCVDYLPGCYQYIPFCYSPLSYYYSCMARYCAVTCGFCTAGSNIPVSIAGYNPALYPTQIGGGGYYPQQSGGYYNYPQQQYGGNYNQQPYQQSGGYYYYPQQQSGGNYYYPQQQSGGYYNQQPYQQSG